MEVPKGDRDILRGVQVTRAGTWEEGSENRKSRNTPYSSLLPSSTGGSLLPLLREVQPHPSLLPSLA